MVNISRLHITLPIIVSLIFAIVVTDSDLVIAEEEGPREYSRNHYFANDELREIIEVRALDNNYDHEETQEMLDRMAAFPRRILKEAVKKDVKLIFTDIPAVELEEFADLEGELSSKNDVTYDEIAGLARDNVGAARIGQSYPGDMHYNALLEYHEFSHMIDFNVLDDQVSNLDEFKKIHKKEYSDMFPGSSYYAYVDEYFAETMAQYFLGGWYRETLKDTAPETFAFMDTFTNRILSVDKNDDKGISLSWMKHPKAESYHVYRDGERIFTTDENQFEDVTFEIYTTHEYTVEAVDEDGEIILETFPREAVTEDNTFFSIDNPENVQVEKSNHKEVTLQWENIENAIYYEIIRDGKLYKTSVLNNFTDDNVKPNTTYKYKIRAVSSTERFVSFDEFDVKTDSRITSWINKLKTLWSNFFIIQIIMPFITVLVVLFIYRLLQKRKHKKQKEE